jgi:transcriptional regulator with XRE-family HTH domain
MHYKPVVKRIALLLRRKREQLELSVRAASKASGLTVATFSRLERAVVNSLPDTETLTKVASWTGVPLTKLLNEKESENQFTTEGSVPEIVEVHLRADKNLAPETAKALAKMFKVLYEQSVQHTSISDGGSAVS